MRVCGGRGGGDDAWVRTGRADWVGGLDGESLGGVGDGRGDFEGRRPFRVGLCKAQLHKVCRERAREERRE